MKQKQYTTNEIADVVGVHVNTIRFYEKIGFITKPDRKPNGYRIFTQLQLEQCKLIRMAMKAEVLQNGLRDKAVCIVRLCAALNFDDAKTACLEYCCMIKKELTNARTAINDVEAILHQKSMSETVNISRSEAAKRLGVTTETLRTWERSGLLCDKHYTKGHRMYTAVDMQRLNIIRTLRCANYSLSAILRLMSELDKNAGCTVERALNIPKKNEDIVSACDRLIISLQSTLEDAKTLSLMVDKMAEKK